MYDTHLLHINYIIKYDFWCSEPFSIVDDNGFIRLLKVLEPRYTPPSRKYMTETVVPKILEGITAAVKHKIAGVEYYSFTTDIWSTSVSNDCLLSLTAHWLSPSFERMTAILHAQPIHGSHTGYNLCELYQSMLTKWNIASNQVHIVIQDNASNMIRAMKDASYEHLGCMAHTLQLIVHDGVLSQRAVQNLTAICRSIVGHFKRSALAYDYLRTIQSNLHLPQHRLKQDVSTRWNSTLYMLQVIIEQKMALAAYSTEHNDTPQLTTHQLDLASKVVNVLTSIEEITKSICTDEASVSLIIPFVRALRLTLEKRNNDTGVCTMKAEMLASLNRRYAGIEKNELLVIATVLDPRFKDKFFTSSTDRVNAIDLIKSKITDSDNPASVSLPESSPASSPKRLKSEVWNCFTEILEQSGALVSESDPSELDQYLQEPLITFHRANSFQWWHDNQHRFKKLAKLARRYLSAPPTSVPSERLFSSAGDIYDEKRNRLAPERAEMLLFIKTNYSLVEGVYDYCM